MMKRVRVVLLTNVPAPYRVPVFNILSAIDDISLTVIYCAENYPDNTWDYGDILFDAIFLKDRSYRKPGDPHEVIHNNPEVVGWLRRLNPDVIITTGFNPTMLFAFLYSSATGKRHIPFSDGTPLWESNFSFFHRVVRKIVYRYSSTFIGASVKTQDLYKSYRVNPDLFYQSHLCVDNIRFADLPATKRFDLMFSGRFIERKNPLFIIEVTEALRSRLGREISLLFVGKGPLEKEMRNQVQRSGLRDCCFNGFATQDELPSLYASALIFVFPSLSDPWGVVANEACAAGLPVITTPYAGVSGELIRDGENGHVCELDVGLWIDRIVPLLEDRVLYDRYSQRSREIVSQYTYERAATGIAQAVRVAVNQKGMRI